MPTEENFMTELYTVIGNPIAHSRSPEIHRLFAEQTGKNISYTKLLAPLDDFVSTVTTFRAQGGKGLNVTAPFKNQAFQWVDKPSERAQLAKAVNTIIFHEDGQSVGDNTDGIGLVHDLTETYQCPITEQQVLILGAGGAVQGCLAFLLKKRPAKLVIVNRSLDKAIRLVEQFSHLGSLKSCLPTGLKKQKFDLIINSIPNQTIAEMLARLPSQILTPTSFCYDMNYQPAFTVFQSWACQQGIKQAVNGLGMLIEQAAEAFYLWHGIRPDTKSIHQLLTGY